MQLRRWQHVAASVTRDPSARGGQDTTGQGLTKLFIDGRRVKTGDIGDGDLDHAALPLCIGDVIASHPLNSYTIGQELSGNSINGRGFSLADMGTRGDGLDNMKQRLEQQGGRFGLDSEPGRGTTQGCSKVELGG